MTHEIHHAQRATVVLFPHTGLEEIQMKWVLSFFDAITLCLPWYMEPPPWIVTLKKDDLIHIMRSSATMKPEPSFPSLLAEYRKWARENLDRGFVSHYGARWDPDSFIENTWKIRQTIRGNHGGNQAEEDTRFLKWHLVLHLARELEEMQSEAASLLTASYEKGSPLQVLFEDDSSNREGEISDSALDLDLRRANLTQVLNAWFGLFGKFVKESPLLLTWDEEVWKAFSEGDDENSGKGEMDLTFRMQWPELSRYPMDELMDLKKKYFNENPFREMKRGVAHFGQNPSSEMSNLDRLKKEVDAILPWGVSDSRMELQLRSISLQATAGEQEKIEEERQAVQKTLVFLRRP